MMNRESEKGAPRTEPAQTDPAHADLLTLDKETVKDLESSAPVKGGAACQSGLFSRCGTDACITAYCPG